MNIYKDDTREIKIRVNKCERCDWCGQDLSELDYGAYVEYILDYRSSDPCMGASGDEFEFGEKYDIDTHAFLHEPYHFCPSPDFGCDQAFLIWMGKKAASDEANYENITLDGCLRELRIKTTTKLIEDGTIKAEELQGD